MSQPLRSDQRLILHQVTPDYDPASDIVLAPWNFAGVESLVSDWHTLGFSDSLASPEAMRDAATNIRLLANHLLSKMIKELNRRHDVDYGSEYWRILVMPWLLHLCQALWKRYVIIDEFVRRHEALSLSVSLCPQDMVFAPNDLFDFNRRILPSQTFNYWLSSRIVERLAPSHWTLNADQRTATDELQTPVSETQQYSVRSYLRDRFRNLRCRQVTGIRWMALPFSIYLNLIPKKARRLPPRTVPGREEIEGVFPAEFLAFVDAVLPRLTPRVLAERYSEMDRMARSRRYRQGRINLVGPVLILNEDDKFRLAHRIENGERIVCAQHGVCGHQKVSINSVEIEHGQDAYLSWGWTAQEDDGGHILDVPSPLFSPYANGHKAEESTLVFVAGEERIFAHRLETGHQPMQAVAARQDRLEFLRSLTNDVRACLRYRPYPGGHGVLPDEAFLRDHFPDIQAIEDRLDDHLMSCRLLVIDHPTTTFGLAMAANVPTVVFLRPDVWSFTRQSEPHFARLRDAGIIFDTPEDAATQIAEVWDDVSTWWARPEIQAARCAFRDDYARTSRVWWWHWAKALWRL